MRTFILAILVTFIGLSSSAQSNSLIDAAFALNNNIVYFIKGDRVVTYDFNNDKVLNTSFLSKGAFPGLSFKKIDAALNYNSSKIYFFSGQYYTRFDAASFSADAGYPKQISSWNFSFTQLDAALSWPEKAYFFKGNQYLRYSKSGNSPDEGYPKQINNSTWPGLTFSQSDAALAIPSGKSYFFYGSEYIRYDQTTDKADAGYPKSLDGWPGLEKALKGQSTNITNNKVTDTDGFVVEEHIINLDVAITSPNSVLCRQYVRPAHDGGFYIAYPDKSTVYVQKFNKSIKKEGSAIVINNYWMSDFLPMKDGSIIFLLGRSVNNTYLGKYPNSIYFLKMNSNGTFESPKLIFGENKHTAGESWFDGRSTGKINFNGFEFGIYFEVQKNWAEQGQEDDIHNGDMFVATDMEGNLKKDRKHFWTASHSSTINLSSFSNGDFYTLTIGDSYPYGLQLYNRNSDFHKVVWPPKEDHVEYKDVNSTNAAGILNYMDVTGNEIIAIMGTLEHPNIGVFDKVNPLFLKFDTEGNITRKIWLAETPGVDETKISACKMKNNQYFIAWGLGNDYDNNWKAGNITVSIINNNGEFVDKPKELEYPFGTYSEIIQLSDGRIVWANAGRSPSKDIHIFVGKLN